MKDCIIWFSRHEPTATQLADMSQAGHDGAPVVHLKAEASRPLLEMSDARETLDMLAQSGATAIFGVFPPILQSGITSDRACETLDRAINGGTHQVFERAIPVFGAWNVNRAPEGERPTFEHRMFIRVGSLLEVREGNKHYRL